MWGTLQSVDPFWIWVSLTCLLLAIEVLVVPTGFFLCLGTSAAIMAALAFMFHSMTWLWMLTIYSILMLLSCLFWLKVMRKKHPSEEDSLSRRSVQLVGERIVLDKAIKNGRGRARVNDSPWPIEADEDYQAGTRVEVIEVRGITLRVKAVEKS